MSNIETVNSSATTTQDPLLRKQKEDVAKMRASLLLCDDDPRNATIAIKNITVLRVYHQISRIVRYLDMMDRIEEKLYASIDANLARIDSNNPSAWMSLLNLQTKLQSNIIESQKLLQPYLNIEEFNIMDMNIATIDSDSAANNGVLSRASRDKLRTSAQEVLAILDAQDNEDGDN